MRHAENKEQNLSADAEKRLWRQFAGKRDSSARQKLIDHYLPLARKIAASLFARRPGSDVEFADYMQYAVVGLIEAVEKYDAGRSASFATYATYRIRGAVLNGIEKTNERTAQYSFKKRIKRERLESLSAEMSGKSSADLFVEMVDVAVGLALGYMLEDSGMYHQGDETANSSDPYSCLEMSRIRDRFRLVVEALPVKEQLVIKYHYYENINFNVIADIMGVSKGRISQIHSRALVLMRQAYGSLTRIDVEY